MPEDSKPPVSTSEDLFAADAGDDETVKSSDVEEFKVKKDNKHRFQFLLPTHRRAEVHEWHGQGNEFRRFYCKKAQGAKCCELDKDAPWPYWFNLVFEYVLEKSGKPALPLQGRVLFFKFKRQKYIDIREKLSKVREERDNQNIRLDEFDFDAALDGDEDYQKMQFTHNLSSILVRYATAEVRKAILDKKITANADIPQALIDTVVAEEAQAKEAEAKKQKFNKSQIATDLLKKYSPVFKAVMEEAEEILKKIPKYWKFASNMSAKEIEDLYSGKTSGEETVKKEIKPEQLGVSESDMKDLLG